MGGRRASRAERAQSWSRTIQRRNRTTTRDKLGDRGDVALGVDRGDVEMDGDREYYEMYGERELKEAPPAAEVGGDRCGSGDRELAQTFGHASET
jgi:hypothetical protein